jgi:hypothetical protein
LFAFNQITLIKSNSSIDWGDLTTYFDLPASPVFKFFFVGGITFDILGVVFALTSVFALRKIANTIHEVKSNVCSVVWSAQNATPGHFCFKRDRCTIPARFPEDLRRLLHIMDYLSNVNFAAVVAFNAGIAFYLMSAFTFGFWGHYQPICGGVGLCRVPDGGDGSVLRQPVPVYADALEDIPFISGWIARRTYQRYTERLCCSVPIF